jgi:transposase
VISLGSDLRILVASKPVDFRKGINGLAALVSTALCANPYSGAIYIFRSKRNDRLKMIVWDGSGMALLTKILEDRHFTWPAVRDGAVHLGASELALLLDGLDWTRVERKPVKCPTKIA